MHKRVWRTYDQAGRSLDKRIIRTDALLEQQYHVCAQDQYDCNVYRRVSGVTVSTTPTLLCNNVCLFFFFGFQMIEIQHDAGFGTRQFRTKLFRLVSPIHINVKSTGDRTRRLITDGVYF